MMRVLAINASCSVADSRIQNSNLWAGYVCKILDVHAQNVSTQKARFI